MEIDFVITWVDGEDPNLKSKRQSYLRGYNYEEREDIAAPTRYRSVGEIGYCVASILRFAPFVRKIFIVTDHQDPGLDGFIARYFPDNTVPIEIVDHTVIFRGYEPYLPTFNSLSIETMLWRIPGLSENFIYMNDDFMLTAPVTPEMWFRDGKMVVYGYWHNTLTALLARKASSLFHREAPMKWRDRMLNAALLVGGTSLLRFIRIQHTPRALSRSLYMRYYDEYPESIVINLRHRFRHKSQYDSQELNYLLALHQDKLIVESATPLLAYYDPTHHSGERFETLMKQLETSPTVRFLCINSLDMAPAEESERLTRWIEKTLGVSLNLD